MGSGKKKTETTYLSRAWYIINKLPNGSFSLIREIDCMFVGPDETTCNSKFWTLFVCLIFIEIRIGSRIFGFCVFRRENNKCEVTLNLFYVVTCC